MRNQDSLLSMFGGDDYVDANVAANEKQVCVCYFLICKQYSVRFEKHKSKFEEFHNPECRIKRIRFESGAVTAEIEKQLVPTCGLLYIYQQDIKVTIH